MTLTEAIKIQDDRESADRLLAAGWSLNDGEWEAPPRGIVYNAGASIPGQKDGERWARNDFPMKHGLLADPSDMKMIPEVVEAWIDSRTRDGWLSPKGNPIQNYRSDLASFARIWFKTYKRDTQHTPKAPGGEMNQTDEAIAGRREDLGNVTKI